MSRIRKTRAHEFGKSKLTNSGNPSSRIRKTRALEFGKAEDIYNKYSNNNIINNNSSIIVTDDEINEKIEYKGISYNALGNVCPDKKGAVKYSPSVCYVKL